MEPEDVLRNQSGLTIEQRLADQAARRRRRRADLPEQGPAVLGDARPGVRRRDVPRVEPLGVRGVRRRGRLERRADAPARVDRHRRRRAGHPRGAVGGRARLRRPVPRQQPDLRPEDVGQPRVQRPGVRAVLVARRRDAAPAHVPRLDRPRPAGRRRQRRRDHQLRLPLHGDHDRAARAADHLGRVRAPPPAAGRPGRVRHRLRAVAARDDGLRLPGAPLLGAPGHPRAALDVLPAELLRHVPGGPRRPRRGRAARPRRQPDVGQRLPAPRGLVAALGRVGRAPDGRPRARTRGRRSSASTPCASSASDPTPRPPRPPARPLSRTCRWARGARGTPTSPRGGRRWPRP